MKLRAYQSHRLALFLRFPAKKKSGGRFGGGAIGSRNPVEANWRTAGSPADPFHRRFQPGRASAWEVDYFPLGEPILVPIEIKHSRTLSTEAIWPHENLRLPHFK